MLETKNLNSRLASEGLRKEALVRAEFEEQLNQKAVVCIKLSLFLICLYFGTTF